MPIVNENQKLISEGISQDLKKESLHATIGSFLNSMAS